MVARLLKKLADVEKMRLHQQPVLQHDDKLVDLDIGNAGLPLDGNRHVAVFFRHERLPAREPRLLTVRFFLASSSDGVKQHGRSSWQIFWHFIILDFTCAENTCQVN